MNMSYCRWRNTATDLRDCADDLEQRTRGVADDELSREEFEAACRLLAKAQDMLGTIRNAVDVYGEADLTLDQIRDGLAKIEQDASRYAAYEEAGWEPTEEDRQEAKAWEIEQAEMEAGWDPNP